MKLFVCIVNDVYRDQMEKQLENEGFRITELASSGGFLRRGNTTFLIGCNDRDVEQLKQSMQNACVQLEQKKKIEGRYQYRYTSFMLSTAQEGEWISRFNQR
ncbi:cyclic-di-AMP receptor [Natribacillus halophilus]|uniref:Uncharacterized protein YaaQ n=1 Tax=Natribacillus halophilus TaxID=549003 RepID=A0A1G8R5B5_9BACI|nr:cyclic-di-AMP receptor [Natribacillus halophilus]SDJ12149.1 Uncharacterized protein YaaQ [Natribacillus halophilus]